MPTPGWWSNEEPREPDLRGALPPGVDVFHASHLFLLHVVLVYHRSLVSMGSYPRVLIFRLASLPCLDRRGARVIGTLAKLCRAKRGSLVLSDVRPGVWRMLGQEGVLDEVGPGNVFAQWNDAVNRAREILRLS
jgi:SulP family sulfate permease